MVKCFVLGCTTSNRDRSGVLFRFPKDAERAQLWAQKIGQPCSIEDARTLYDKYVCRNHFLETDFTTPKRKRLNRGAVPCSSGLTSQEPTPQLPDSTLTDLNSLPSLLSPQKNIHVQPPIRTYGKLSMSSSSIQTFPSILEDSPCSSSQICVVKSTPPAASMFVVEDISCPLNLNASDGEFRHINSQNPSLKRRARHTLLRELNLATVSGFTPREKLLYDKIRNKESALCKLRRKCRQNFKFVFDEEVNTLMGDISTSLNAEGIRLLKGIFRNSKRKPKGRRWNFKDKMVALSLLKRSPKSYSFLRLLLPLPSRRTLQSILSTVHFAAGINAHVFGALQHTLQKMSDRDRYCCLLFDEMSIRENVRFNQKLDCIEGFEDYGTESTRIIANHALVFMVRGLHRKWKQPVAYYFIRGSTKANLLVRFLKEVLGACQNAGLHVVATVCDMGANNVKALQLLGATRQKPFFKFQNREIVTVYDPPHLLKCTRNLFSKYDVQFESESMPSQLPVTAKWKHIVNVYEWDKQNIVRIYYKLSKAHFKLKAQDAMKVSLAAQVMSHTVGAGLNSVASQGKFGADYVATAVFVKEVDQLFDSFNSYRHAPPFKKLLRPLSSDSHHMGYWDKAGIGVSRWIFLKDGKPAFNKPPPSQTGWLVNIGAVRHVWRMLKKAGFKYLETRNLNQDPLENTFGVIRLHCGSNNNPTVGQFVDALKTSIINGLAFRDLSNTNCEDDKTELLDNLHSFLEESDASLPHPSTSHGTGTDGAVSIHVAEQVQQEEMLNCDMKLLSVAYVSGFIARRVLRDINCDDCTTCLTSPMVLGTNAFIYFKEYEEDKQFLTYPSEKLVETVGASISLLESKMAEVAHMGSVEEKMTVAIKETVDFGWIWSSGCSLHSQKIVNGIVRGVTRIAIPWWCKRTNRVMNEENRWKVSKRKLKILSHK